jgi:hypothetical protein
LNRKLQNATTERNPTARREHRPKEATMADVKGTVEGRSVTTPDPKKKGTTITVQDEFGFNELKSINSRGGGNRGIKIFLKGSPKGAQEYKFDPNPHADGDYNQGEHVKFYKEAAEALVELYYDGGNKFPRYGTKSISALTKSYKLVSW